MIACAVVSPQVDAFTLASLIGLVAGLSLIVRGFVLRSRLPEASSPTSKIANTSPGFVEVGGFASGPYTIPAPISGLPCYLYRASVWQRSSSSGLPWEKTAEERMHLPFFLDDSTGQLLVDPAHADLDVPCDVSEEYDATSFSDSLDPIPAGIANFLSRLDVNPSGIFRIEERCIKPKSQVFVMGTLAESSSNTRPFSPENDRTRAPNTPAYRGAMAPPAEVIRLSESTAETGPGPTTQQARIAAALNKAGLYSSATGDAKPAAAAETRSTPRVSEIAVNGTNPKMQSQEPRSTPAAVLRKGQENPAFLISWRSPYVAARAFVRKAVAMIWGGAVLTILACYILLLGLGLL